MLLVYHYYLLQNIKIRKLAAKLLGKVASVNVFSLIGNFTNTTGYHVYL
jgi:hypothetical protein